MSPEDTDVLRNLEVHPLGENGEMEILPISDDILLTSRLPCGLPPILPDTHSVLNGFLQNLELLPVLQVDFTQRYLPSEPNACSLYNPQPCPLMTELTVKRDVTSGKLLGFVEREKDFSGGTTNTSTSLSRAPGRPEFGVRGSTNSFPFWPGGMDEPWADLIMKEPLDSSLLYGEYLDTPPGFEKGISFERQYPIQKEPAAGTNQSKITLNDLFAMEDLTDFASSDDIDGSHDVKLENITAEVHVGANVKGIEDDLLKIESLPVLKISDVETKEEEAVQYKWAVVENVLQPVSDFNERIHEMAFQWDFELDTFQKKAILHLEKQDCVFVAAHTSAGKTVVAEYAIALAKKHMTRVLYTSPIKALSNQKFREFKESFGDVGLITGDVLINERAFCLIMTTEILRSMLYHGSDILREVEWVIFDEVHYINDAERGVVWEEVFIMLPQHVNLIMLSATVPNTAQFAEWLGGIKRRKIYVISTLERPTPLVHHLYTGSVGRSQEAIFPIIDAKGNFLNEMYTKAINSKKEQEPKGKSTGPKESRHAMFLSQEKNVYIGILGYLRKKNLLPVICFTLSRKKCKDLASTLQSQNLTSSEEKSQILYHFRHSISKLKADDKKLGQVKRMKEQLLNGFGVHHSGILPILKEVVEMLFQKGLVKVLFATETFAMGVNMPARTVVFDSVRKHDGREYRTLQPSEYIQMAGRAGRRGKDKIGTVIILCKEDVPEVTGLCKMMMGKPTTLQSQFRLTYCMILNLLKVRTLRVEDVMKRSFGESSSQKLKEEYQEKLNEATSRLLQSKQMDCSLCLSDMEEYCKLLLQMTRLQEDVMEKVSLLAMSNRTLSVGSFISFSLEDQHSVPGLVLSFTKDNNCKVLTIQPKLGTDMEVMPWSKSLSIPNESQPAVLTIPLSAVLVITKKSLKVDSDNILKEWDRMEKMRCNPGRDISAAFQELYNLCQANRKGLTGAPLKFLNISLASSYKQLLSMQESTQIFTCIKCPQFSKHFCAWSGSFKLKDQINNLKFLISEESLLLHAEYNNRKEVLKSLKYIDGNDVVQLKGSVAREVSNHELLITELLVKNIFADCSPEEIAALLSCMVFQHKLKEKLEDTGISKNLLKKIGTICAVIEEINRKQIEVDVIEPEFVEQYNFHLTHVVYEWARGVNFAQIMETINIDVEEGIIVRCIQRLSELLKDVRSAANLVGDTVLAKKMSDASALIKRDIVFAASLYIQ